MLATLRIVHRRANLRQVKLCPVTVVGRSAECQLRIASTEVSRRHCQLLLRPDGVYLEDLGSANGTFLDGVRVPQRTPTYAHPGACLDVGPARFVLDYATDDSTQLYGPETQAMIPAAAIPPVPVTATVPCGATANVTASGPAMGSSFDFADPVSAPPRRSFFDLFRRRQTLNPSSATASPNGVVGNTPAAQSTETPLLEIAVVDCPESPPDSDNSLSQFLKQL